MRGEPFRVRLEGGAETIEVAAVRLRALVSMLESLGWRDKLAANDDLLQAILHDHAQLLTALQRARKLLKSDPTPSLEKLVERTEEQLRRAAVLLEKKVGAKELARGLELLRAEVAPVPEGEGKLWRQARLLLDTEQARSLRELSHALHPLAVARRWTKEDWTELLRLLPPLDERCAALWKVLPPPVEQRLLRRVSRPRPAPVLDAAYNLVSAESLRRDLHARIEKLLADAFGPLEPQPAEEYPLLRFLAEGGHVPQIAPLHRARALALAARLAEGPPQSDEQWRRLEGLAEGIPDGSAEAVALVDNLTLFLRIREHQKTGKAPRPPRTLSESLLRLRALSSPPSP